MSETTNNTPAPKSSGLAIAGLVLGILAAAGSFLPIINNLSFFIALIGLVLAIIALVGALKGKNSSKGMAIAGVVLCVVSCVVVLVTQSAYKAALDEVTSGSKPVATSNSEQSASSSQSDDAAADSQKQEEKKEENKEQDYTNLAVGSSVELKDGLVVTVNSVDTSLRNYNDTPVVGVNVTYTNNGDKSQSFNPYDWKGEDANGAQRTTTFFMDGSDELNSGTLSAGGTVTGNIYFEDGTVRALYYSNMFNDSATASWNLQ